MKYAQDASVIWNKKYFQHSMGMKSTLQIVGIAATKHKNSGQFQFASVATIQCLFQTWFPLILLVSILPDAE